MTFTIRGGVRIGWIDASWPLAELSASPSSLTISGGLLGTYSFGPTQVVALEPHRVIPVVGQGVKVVHGHPEYPSKIIFWVFGDPEHVIARIRDAGFTPSCPANAVRPREGVPFRWSAVALAVVLWNALFWLDGFVPGRVPRAPGPFVLVALVLAFTSTWALPRSAFLQSFVLREGRSVGEIRAVISLLQLICGLLLVVFSAVFLFARATA